MLLEFALWNADDEGDVALRIDLRARGAYQAHAEHEHEQAGQISFIHDDRMV